MHPYLGDFAAGATVPVAFNTSDLDAAPITLTSGTIRVYRDDSTTEDDSGITLTADYDSRTGLHRVDIDLSSDGTFYAAAHDFFVVITVGTVDGVSVVGKCVAQFSIANRYKEAAAAFTTQVGSTVATDGQRPTPAQALYGIYQFLFDRGVSGTTMTVYAPDGTTPLMTFTLNDPSTPTAYTRAT